MQIALGCGSLVLLAGGLTAAVLRTIRPAQALTIALLAAGVGLVAFGASWVAGRSMGGLYLAAVVLPTTLAGMATAVWVVAQRPRKIR